MRRGLCMGAGTETSTEGHATYRQRIDKEKHVVVANVFDEVSDREEVIVLHQHVSVRQIDGFGEHHVRGPLHTLNEQRGLFPNHHCTS